MTTGHINHGNFNNRTRFTIGIPVSVVRPFVNDVEMVKTAVRGGRAETTTYRLRVAVEPGKVTDLGKVATGPGRIGRAKESRFRSRESRSLARGSLR